MLFFVYNVYKENCYRITRDVLLAYSKTFISKKKFMNIFKYL